MPDLSLYLVTDRGLSLGRATVDIVRAAVAGGVNCVQLREKHIRAGCNGVAVVSAIVSAIVSAPDPQRAAAELQTIIHAAKELP